MLYLYEIEIFKDDDYYIAVPFDFDPTSAYAQR